MTAQATPLIYDNVPEDGDIGHGAIIPVDGFEHLSAPEGGTCGDSRCACAGTHTFTRLFPRDAEGVVFGYVVEFESREELEGASIEEIESIARHALH